MRVAELTAYVVNVPLRREIKHASATRRESANLLVCARLTDGTEGWGEGVPRSYVTGETPNTAIVQLTATPLSDQLTAKCASWQDVIAMCEAFQPTISTEDLRGCGRDGITRAESLSGPQVSIVRHGMTRQTDRGLVGVQQVDGGSAVRVVAHRAVFGDRRVLVDPRANVILMTARAQRGSPAQLRASVAVRCVAIDAIEHSLPHRVVGRQA